jgi:hypothetical protein
VEPEIKIAQETDADDWNRIIESSSHGSLHHTWAWLKIMERHTRTKLYPLIVYNGTEPLGIFPLFYQKKGYIRSVFSPPPKSGILALGPVIANYDSFKQNKKEHVYNQVQETTNSFIQNEIKADYISVSLPFGLNDPRPFAWTGYEIAPRYDYVTDLRRDPAELWKQLKAELRQSISRAEKKGVIVETGQEGELERLFCLMEKRYEEQGMVLPISKKYLFDVYSAYKDHFTIFVGKFHDDTVTGIVHVAYKDRFFSWIGNVRSPIQISPSPNDLVRWDSIKFASEQGYKEYIQMGAAGNMKRHAHFNKFNPSLHIRYVAKRYSAQAKLMEKSYISFIKPLSSQISLWKRKMKRSE